jgi:hypothetical protein
VEHLPRPSEIFGTAAFAESESHGSRRCNRATPRTESGLVLFGLRLHCKECRAVELLREFYGFAKVVVVGERSFFKGLRRPNPKAPFA